MAISNNSSIPSYVEFTSGLCGSLVTAEALLAGMRGMFQAQEWVSESSPEHAYFEELMDLLHGQLRTASRQIDRSSLHYTRKELDDGIDVLDRSGADRAHAPLTA